MNKKYIQILLLSLLIFSVTADAEISFEDITGQTITLKQPAQRVLLGEGRFIAALGVLGIENPIKRIAGMMDEFRQFDSAGFSAFATEYPAIENVPTFGRTTEDSASIEQMLLLKPDAAIFGLSGHGPGARSKHIIKRLKSAGIPVVFIDFRQDPIKNTSRSIEILGHLLGTEQSAKHFVQLYEKKLNHIKTRVKNIALEDYPSVLIELRATPDSECCLSVGKGLFAAMAKLTGGQSMANGLIPGAVGQISYEHVIANGFDIYIGTATGGKATGPLAAGVGVSESIARDSLSNHLRERRFNKMPAVKAGNAYALWHHFYNSPLNIYAIESMAKWFHPEQFKDLNPEKTLQQLLSGFYKVNLQGTYAVSITPNKNK